MIKFEKIKTGQLLWDVRKNSGFGRWKYNTWPVVVHEVDTEKRMCLASWNGNKPEWMTENRITKFRAKKPIS